MDGLRWRAACTVQVGGRSGKIEATALAGGARLRPRAMPEEKVRAVVLGVRPD